MKVVPTTADRFIAWLTEFVVRQRYVLLAMAVIATVVCYRPAQSLKLDESIESFFAPTDPLLQEYIQSKARFGGDEFVLVAYSPVPREGTTGPVNLISAKILEETEKFAEELSQVPGVKTSSTLHLKKPFHPLAVTRMPTIHNKVLSQVRGILISEDEETLAIMLRLLPSEKAPVSRRETIQKIRDLAAQHQPQTYVAGEPVQVQDMFLYVEKDSVLLGVTSSVLMVLVIVFMFRSIRWMILPLLVVHPTLLWTMGLLASTGLRLSMVSSMLTSLTTIIGVATVMHIAVEYREARLLQPRLEAFRAVFEKLAIPIFWTIVTTAIGFGSLLTSNITPVRSFGLMMLVASMLVMVACIAFLPAGILIGKHDTILHHGHSEKRLTTWLEWLFDIVTSRRWTTIAVLLGITAFSAWGLRYLTIETDFSKNFRDGSPIVQSLNFFESKFGGVGTWEVNFDAPKELDEKFLDRVRKLAADLESMRRTPGDAVGAELTKIVSLPSPLDAIPPIAGPTLELRREILKIRQPELESSLYNPEQGRMRIMLRARERQNAEVKLELIRRVQEIARQTFPEAEVTGLYVLLANLISSLLRDQLTSYGLSVVLIVICVWIPFRRLSWAIIAMFPNVLPTLWLIGGMGWLGLPINIGTAMIASVSLGLTIDSSIHYLAGYQRAIREGKPHLQALRESSTHIGRALVLSNVALVLGFSVLSLSNFLPLVYFGILVSFAMLSGLVGNLVLLPSLMLGLDEIGNAADSDVAPGPEDDPEAA